MQRPWKVAAHGLFYLLSLDPRTSSPRVSPHTVTKEAPIGLLATRPSGGIFSFKLPLV